MREERIEKAFFGEHHGPGDDAKAMLLRAPSHVNIDVVEHTPSASRSCTLSAASASGFFHDLNSGQDLKMNGWRWVVGGWVEAGGDGLGGGWLQL